MKMGKCQDCQFPVTESETSLFEFDHLPQYSKSWNVSELQNVSSPIALIAQEMAKCELVCQRCHRLRSYTRRKKEAEERLNQYVEKQSIVCLKNSDSYFFVLTF